MLVNQKLSLSPGKTNVLNSNYVLYNFGILSTDCFKDCGVLLGTKLYFHQHVYYLFSHAKKSIGLIRNITLRFSLLGSVLLLYISLVRKKLEYASVVWNFLTITDANKLELAKRSFLLHVSRDS
jgi:hypothetical protein